MTSFELNDDDVVSMEASENFTDSKTSKVEDMMYEIRELLKSADLALEEWVSEGFDCEVLRAEGGGWQTGKIRLYIGFEFIPGASPEKSTRRSVSRVLARRRGIRASSVSPLADLRSNLDIQ
jgi:hypothetical protein